MTQKVFIEADDTVTLTCSRCNKTRIVDVSRFKGHTRAKVRCKCGHIDRIQLEKRRQYRKATDLRGTYKVIPTDNSPPDSGVMAVVDISRNGVRMKFKDPVLFKTGDRINIRFNLDDKNMSLVERDVIVQNIEPPYVGAKFHRPNEMDNVIGFYLFK